MTYLLYVFDAQHWESERAKGGLFLLFTIGPVFVLARIVYILAFYKTDTENSK